MKITAIRKMTGQIELISGLHIGSGDSEMHIGGTDNPVVKNPINREPYIPGSSIKGKVRSLLEWELGVVGKTKGRPLGFSHVGQLEPSSQDRAKGILRLFGGAPEGDAQSSLITEIGPTRLAFWDCALDRHWVAELRNRNLLLTETKMENMIDRIKGVAQHPRNTERVPAGSKFDFGLTLRIHDDEDLSPILFRGLRLLELTGLGGSGSRGYGKLRFNALKLDDEDVLGRLQTAPAIQ